MFTSLPATDKRIVSSERERERKRNNALIFFQLIIFSAIPALRKIDMHVHV